MKKLLLTTLFIAVASQSGHARLAPSETHANNYHKKSSFRNLLTDCTERSISLSCHRAGIYYIDKRDEVAKGLAYLNQSCELGRGCSCTVLGKYYNEGKIVKYDHKKAKEYFNKGCIKESQEGCKEWENFKEPVVKKSHIFPSWFFGGEK